MIAQTSIKPSSGFSNPGLMGVFPLPATARTIPKFPPVRKRTALHVVGKPAPAVEYARKTAAGDDWLVERLMVAPVFREYRRAFEAATGLPLTLRPVQSWRLAHHGDRHQGAFCALMARANHSRAALLRLQQEVCEGANGVPCTKSYPFGIIETAVRVKVDGKIVANLLTGQILLHPPTRQQIRLVVRQIRAWQLGKNAEQAIHLYRSTRVMPRHEYLACVKLLEFFAEQLGTIANQILLQQQTAEPVQITRARQFIEQHYFEKIDLAEISRQAGMCTFYFSKRFKEVTGLNFTGYVSRLRVEKAKQLLLNHHFRVSEIGFEIGFQSLTHFNRQFKKIAGCSPTEYRCHLPTV